METDREIKSNLKAVRLASYQACKLASFLTLILGHFETLTLFSHLPQERLIKEKTMEDTSGRLINQPIAFINLGKGNCAEYQSIRVSKHQSIKVSKYQGFDTVTL